MPTTSQADIDKRISHFTRVCRETGARLTHQRLEIFREVASTGDHPDVDTVFKRVRERMPTVSLDTVYRTLWWLKDLGLVRTLGPPRERTRFDANLNNHHHFVCLQCGQTSDFNSEKLNRIEIQDDVKTIGYAELTHVEVKGVCLRCANHNQ